MPKIKNENLLVGIDTSDDAAVYKINDETAVIQTLDFFTPIVDDPYTFGKIAATNSLSDVYAMGGDPVLALNIACFPACEDMNILGEILRGGADKVKEAGAIIVGGHTVDDREPKYGLSVMGIVHPDKILPNASSRPGDLLILTKPIGTGVISTASKGEIAEEKHMDVAVKYMSTLNRYAAERARKYKVNACTDITGFGLVGHALEMAEGSGVTIHLESRKVRYIEGAEEYAKMGLIPAGTYRNKKYAEGKYLKLIEEEHVIDLLFDPQTSGGLLYSLPETEANRLNRELNESGVDSFIVGYVTEFRNKHLIIE
ncbi:selenophosphate synthase [Fonticella tunisiensis]|uniref:Selenide, water dikinase n=1 Tax=Fonticella tunisiensis TaxID=1096341 RepID=A0A4R7KSZ5_9CLOT|nr:selenophosphate synthase [Fonticella tunisiensis]